MKWGTPHFAPNFRGLASYHHIPNLPRTKNTESRFGSLRLCLATGCHHSWRVQDSWGQRRGGGLALRTGGQMGGICKDALRAVTLKRTWVRRRPCQAGTPVYMLHNSTPALHGKPSPDVTLIRILPQSLGKKKKKKRQRIAVTTWKRGL
jgi:hypothetical protein